MNKKRALIIIIALVVVLLTAALASAARARHGSLRVQAVNAYTLEPIEGAYVVAVGCGKSAYTDALGFAYLSDMPLLPNAAFTGPISCAWGEANLLAYAEGYLPYALLHATVYYDTLRLGPTLYLFPEGEAGVSVTTIIESPKEADMEKLIELYRPK